MEVAQSFPQESVWMSDEIFVSWACLFNDLNVYCQTVPDGDEDNPISHRCSSDRYNLTADQLAIRADQLIVISLKAHFNVR